MNSVVIVGGGFSGAVTAVNLVRLTDAPLSVTVVNSGHPLGRGVAYGTRRPEHLLNVVARNMSALADQPDHFVDWLLTRSDFADVPLAELRESFIPRRIYGDYLQSLLLWYSHALADGKKVRIQRVEAEALDVVPSGGQVLVELSHGPVLEADKVVLATGNPAPTDLPGLACDHPCYFRDPWSGWEQRLTDPTQSVVLLGTGLTMVDAFLTLDALRWRGKIIAVSRNGLLPLSHFKGPDYPDFPPGDPTRMSLDELLALFRAHGDRLRAAGLEPAILVDKLRPWTQRIWQHFSLADKQRFLSELRTPWNVTRHRCPQAASAKVTAALNEGRLEVVKGRITGLSAEGSLRSSATPDALSACRTPPRPEGFEDSALKAAAPDDSGIKALLRHSGEGGLHLVVDEGTGAPRTIRAAAVVNCTGPAEGYPGGSILYANLLRRGLVSADEVGLGIRALPDFAAVDKLGHRSKWLMVLGPPLKGVLWETTAVPELRAQAFRVAEVIVADMHARRAEVRAVEETYADVLEYTI
jgi:uncharacterized NAD(P)/FAD-binding protein YdhS